MASYHSLPAGGGGGPPSPGSKGKVGHPAPKQKSPKSQTYSGGRGGPTGASHNPYATVGAAASAAPRQPLTPPQPAAAAPGGGSGSPGGIAALQAVLDRFEITIAEANDLAVLADYEIIFIADDSGSMGLAAQPPGERQLGVQGPSRWHELCETVKLLVEIAVHFDHDGIDIYFLNRAPVTKVRSSADARLAGAFAQPPRGTTPLTECLRDVAKRVEGERPVLLVIATDGEPDGGSKGFVRVVEDLVLKRTTQTKFRFQIMACTGDDDAVGWINTLDCRKDAVGAAVDCTDDFYTERKEVLRAGRVKMFRRSDWVIKALMGPVSTKFDQLDEPLGGRRGGTRSADDGGGACCSIL